jgi:predicted PurR-regulated permease PerM
MTLPFVSDQAWVTWLRLGAAAVLLFILWRLSAVALLFLAALLVATAINAVAEPLHRRVGLSQSHATFIVTLAGLAIVAGFAYSLGAELQSQVQHLSHQFPATIRAWGQTLGLPDLDTRLLALIEGFPRSDTILNNIADYTGDMLAVGATIFLVVVSGAYVSADPELYRNGVLALTPPPYRPAIVDLLTRLHASLRSWLLGQLAICAYIGTVTATILFLLGMPSPLALGLIAGLMEFLPFIGPLLSAIPAMVIAFSTGDPLMPVWVAFAYLAIQQIEGNFISPVVFHWALRLPPVVALFSLLAFGTLFGPLGVLLALPLAVVVMVLIKALQPHDIVHTPRLASASLGTSISRHE